ncbi:MAG: iron-containing alcohol dehydrogenase family protein [Cyanobacteria bacterium P01_C01_bin.118]
MSTISTLMVAPAQVVRGSEILSQCGSLIQRLGQRPLLVGGNRTLRATSPVLTNMLEGLSSAQVSYQQDCCETTLAHLRQVVKDRSADVIVGVGGGKALDTAKLVAHQTKLPVVTIPTSAATCAAWTALSNVYSDHGAFRYDVGLPTCPELLLLDYDLIATAPKRTLVAGIGDAIAKWYEASVSSGHSNQTLIIGAVQQARVLRDILFQKSAAALENPGGEEWREVVDASVLMAGVIGGMGGAQCRTVAAHAVHNGLTQLPASHNMLHGEKVAYGILVQLRLEEMELGNALAVAARQQLLRFYSQIGLPMTLSDLGLGEMSLMDLRQAAEFACQPKSDIHHLPFDVSPQQVMAAMVSTTVPCKRSQTSQTEQSVSKLSVMSSHQSRGGKP